MTTPAAPGPLSCEVLLDGVPLPDGAAGDPTALMVLDDLRVTWGRGNTLDQPSPATCAAVLWDPAGGQSFLDLLSTSKRLDVRTSTLIFPAPSVPVITDPGFAVAGPGQSVSNGTLTIGGGTATLVPTDPARRARVIFPPAPFAAPGLDPGAWDHIPTVAPGSSWSVGCSVRLPPALAPVAAAVVVRPVVFTAPWVSAARVLPDPEVTVPAGTTGWHPTVMTFPPPPYVWVGVCVDLYPTGTQWDQLPPALTWDALPATVRWDDLAATGIDDLVVLAPAAGAARTALVFGGRITDLTAEADPAGGNRVTITAQDHTAELANRDIAAQPWAMEDLGTRAGRIITQAGQDTRLIVDPGPAAVLVTRMDVDNQPATTLLQQLAVTADGVLWSAVHTTTGQYLWLEDTHARPALLVLALVGGVVTLQPSPDFDAVISACDVMLDPVQWVQDVADVATRVAVRWVEQTTPPAATVEHTTAVSDAGLIDRLGVRRIAVNSALTTSAAAAALATRVLARTSAGGWRVAGLTWQTGLDDLDPAGVARAFTLLDGTSRLGAGIRLVDLPDTAPVTGGALPLFLEGGTYRFTGGQWVLDLTVSRATAQGTTLTWDQLDPTWRWDQFDPTITWDQLAGVSI